jgi:hypothetical protein
MDRRDVLRAGAGLALGSVILPSEAFFPLLFRFLFSSAIRAGGSVAVRSSARTVLTRTVTAGATRKTVQVVTTRELGVSIAGVSYVSVAAAEAIEKHKCTAICVQGQSDSTTLISDNPVRQSINLAVNFVNVAANRVEHDWGMYVAPGEFRYSIDFPRFLTPGVKRLDGYSPTPNKIKPFSSGNIYLAGMSDVFI